jgi:hypothetical protein
MKNFEIKTVEHKGIKVPIQINYDKGEVTLVENFHTDSEMSYRAKQWLFKGRSLEYMDSWINILEAMTVAVKECKALLEKDLAEKTRLEEETYLRVGAILKDMATKDTHASHVDVVKMELRPIKKRSNKK